MGLSKTMKRTRRRGGGGGKKLLVPPIGSLPRELVTEVLGRVAASSFIDFFNAKLSCKAFQEVADDKYVFQRVLLDKFPVVPWRISEEASFFLNRCKESGNPEALYRQGVVDYFSHMRLESGLECLKRAANSGHIGALYVLGIILLFSGDEFKQRGIEILKSLKSSKVTNKRVGECRKKLKDIIGRSWIRNHLILEQKPTFCTMRDQHKEREGWPSSESDGEDNLQCEACRYDREVVYFCRMLRGF